jgi:MYXO-CTERM domain-containing protein
MRTAANVSLVLASLVLAPSARAADFYVDASAAAGGNGSMSNPFQTINAALGGLARGDTVWIATGTYPETVNISTLPGSTGRTTLRAIAGNTPVIDGTNGSASAGFVLQSAVEDTTFMGLTIQNAVGGALGIQFYHADGGQVLGCTTKNMSANAVTFYYSSQGEVSGSTLQGNVSGRKTTGTVVENNEVYGASAEGIGLYDGSTGCTVAHNIIHDNYSVNLYLDSISHSTFDGNLIYETTPGNDLEGIEISDEYYPDLPAPVNSYNIITNNVIVGHNQGITFWFSGEWPTAALNNESGLRYDVIANNTVVNNVSALKWDASPAHVGTTIQNNIFAAQAAASPNLLLQANSAGGIGLDHNLWYAPSISDAFLWLDNAVDHAGFVSASMQGGGDVLSDPMFAGSWSVPPATNLELTKGSPAIGAGVTLSQVPDDYLGAPRPSGKYDLGAFQYGAKPPSDGGVGPGPDASTGPGADGGKGSSPDGGIGPGTDAGKDARAGSGNGEAPGASSGCACSSVATRSGQAGALAVLGVALLGLGSRRRRFKGSRRR